MRMIRSAAFAICRMPPAWSGLAAPAAETLEGLVRQVLKRPNHPAVVLLFMMNRQGANAQEWHGKIGRHYGLPMVSFRDALWPEIQAGSMKWEDVEADMVHPNDVTRKLVQLRQNDTAREPLVPIASWSIPAQESCRPVSITTCMPIGYGTRGVFGRGSPHKVVHWHVNCI